MNDTLKMTLRVQILIFPKNHFKKISIHQSHIAQFIDRNTICDICPTNNIKMTQHKICLAPGQSGSRASIIGPRLCRMTEQ